MADKFLEKFQAALAAFKPGDPMDRATTLGPLSTEAALVQLLGQIKRAVAKGAKLVMGGKRIDRPGSYMQTDDSDEHQARQSRLSGRILWAGRTFLPRQERG